MRKAVAVLVCMSYDRFSLMAILLLLKCMHCNKQRKTNTFFWCSNVYNCQMILQMFMSVL